MLKSLGPNPRPYRLARTVGDGLYLTSVVNKPLSFFGNIYFFSFHSFCDTPVFIPVFGGNNNAIQYRVDEEIGD